MKRKKYKELVGLSLGLHYTVRHHGHETNFAVVFWKVCHQLSILWPIRIPGYTQLIPIRADYAPLLSISSVAWYI